MAGIEGPVVGCFWQPVVGTTPGEFQGSIRDNGAAQRPGAREERNMILIKHLSVGIVTGDKTAVQTFA